MKCWLMILLLPFCAAAQQTPAYQYYRLIYYDEFDYDPATFRTDGGFNRGGVSNGVAYGNWHIGDSTQWAQGAEEYDARQVTMPEQGVVRLSANRIERYYAGPRGHGGGGPGSDEPFYRSFRSGWINSNREVGPFGMMEVRMTIPSGHPWCSFYMDNIYQSILSVEGMWSDSSWISHVTGERLLMHDSGVNHPTMERDVYHVYTVEWRPERVLLYMDGMQTASIAYAAQRTNSTGVLLKIGLSTYPQTWGNLWTEDSLHLDIDYVKVWTMKEDAGPLYLQQYAGTAGIVPGLYKSDTLVSCRSANVLRTDAYDGTVLQAPAVTIDGNFLADETMDYRRPIMVPGKEAGTTGTVRVVYDGYLEITPVKVNKAK